MNIMALLTRPRNGFNHLTLEINPAQGMVFCISHIQQLVLLIESHSLGRKKLRCRERTIG